MTSQQYKILIVTTFFPPQNSIASLRPYSWAKYWSKWGHRVTVLTTLKKASSADLAMPFQGFNVIEMPIPFFKSRSEIGQINTLLSTKPLQRTARSIIEKLRNTYGIFLARMPNHHDIWAISSLPLVSQTKWDVVVSTAPPYSSHILACFLNRSQLAKLWIADWRDPWTDDQRYPGLPGLRILERWIEQHFYWEADLVTTVSEPLAKQLQARFSRRVDVIYNGFDPEDYLTLPNEKIFLDDQVFRIVYTGTIHPNFQKPTPLFRAIKLLEHQKYVSPHNLRVIFAGYNIDSTILSLAQQENVESYVELAGFIPRIKALHMQRDADALLFLESPHAEGVLTGKLFEYLVAGPPILAIGVSRGSAADQLIESYQRGTAYGMDVERIAYDILRLIRNKERGKTTTLDLRIRQFSRIEQAKKMLSLIDQHMQIAEEYKLAR